MCVEGYIYLLGLSAPLWWISVYAEQHNIRTNQSAILTTQVIQVNKIQTLFSTKQQQTCLFKDETLRSDVRRHRYANIITKRFDSRGFQNSHGENMQTTVHKCRFQSQSRRDEGNIERLNKTI